MVKDKTKQILWNLLGKPKDQIDNFEKFGIYERIYNGSSENYYGLSWRAIRIRYNEYLTHIIYGMSKNS